MKNAMKTISKYMLATLLIAGEVAFCQTAEQTENVVQSLPIEITYNKTTSIIFQTVIESVDRGSRDILAQKAKGVGNVLHVKAGREQFPETNLTVITSDGILHHFTVNYSKEPTALTIDVGRDSGTSELIFPNKLTEADLMKYAEAVAASKRSVHFVAEKEDKIHLALLSIDIKEDVIFFRFMLTNLSNINYDVEFFKFYIHDKARIKRTASQEIELKPIFTYGDDTRIGGKSTTDIVYALRKFTIPESKYMDIEMFEQGGGRNLRLRISNKTIVNARLIK